MEMRNQPILGKLGNSGFLSLYLGDRIQWRITRVVRRSSECSDCQPLSHSWEQDWSIAFAQGAIMLTSSSDPEYFTFSASTFSPVNCQQERDEWDAMCFPSDHYIPPEQYINITGQAANTELLGYNHNMEDKNLRKTCN